jgi:hypothetical protein
MPRGHNPSNAGRQRRSVAIIEGNTDAPTAINAPINPLIGSARLCKTAKSSVSSGVRARMTCAMPACTVCNPQYSRA